MFEQEIILENDYVLLRPLVKEDIIHLEHFAKEEPELWKYSFAQIQNVEDLKKYIEDAVNNRKQNKEYAFIVFDKLQQAYAGSTRFYDIQIPFSSLQLGYTWYGKKFQGTLLNKNCKLLLLEYAFEVLNMQRVEFRANNLNERSKQAMMSIGCKEEGVLRSHLPDAFGGRRDSIILSILKKEWEEGVKDNLIKKLSK